MLPKLGPSLAATIPAGVKFGTRWLDKGVKLTKPWQRTQEYAAVGTLVVGGVMVYADAAPGVGRSIWDGSIAIITDQLLGKLFEWLKPAGNPGGNPGANKQLTAEQRALLAAGRAGATQGAQGAAAKSVLEF